MKENDCCLCIIRGNEQSVETESVMTFYENLLRRRASDEFRPAANVSKLFFFQTVHFCKVIGKNIGEFFRTADCRAEGCGYKEKIQENKANNYSGNYIKYQAVTAFSVYFPCSL